jgi:hypothetical protein
MFAEPPMLRLKLGLMMLSGIFKVTDCVEESSQHLTLILQEKEFLGPMVLLRWAPSIYARTSYEVSL